jgi:uncharacterized membrane protein YhaH (DUF805 family)
MEGCMNNKGSFFSLRSLRHLFFSLEGRINRKSFWIGYIIFLIVQFALVQLLVLAFDNMDLNISVAKWIGSILTLYLFISLLIKRGHDLDKSGLESTLLMLVPIVNLWILIEIFFFRSFDGDNAYGRKLD